ncbi:hypothetical protein HOY80DRAFT_675598 [Tuber brumale]|nr:hypothetical protein HOY80DRAFT_675598 [Tuber brumale]
MPETTEDVNIHETRCDDLIAPVSSISDHILLGHLTRQQACYLPILNPGGSGGRRLGEPGTESLLMPRGYLCWGINSSPALLKLSSEIGFESEEVSLDMRQVYPPRIP